MKKLYLAILAIFCCIGAYAQQYQCFQHDDTVHWYIDTIGYLRMIRIDSVKVSGTDTIYYPYLSMRPPWGLAGFAPTAPSWMCAGVRQKPDGTFLFSNVYGDTVIIKTQAAVGDSWVLYNDTTGRYYTATVTGQDTMTINGVIDSVKSITIHAYAPLVDPGDYVDGFVLMLSRDHGFAQVCDLYNFPFHTPGSAGFNSYDAYAYLLAFPRQAQLFRQTFFREPTLLQMYDYHPGDNFQRHKTITCGTMAGSGLDEYLQDSVIYRADPDPYHATVVLQHTVFGYSYPCAAPEYRNYYGYSSTDTLLLDTTAVYRILPRPEEYGQMFVHFYEAADTSYCLASPLHAWKRGYAFEACYIPQAYKEGLGLVDSEWCVHSIGAPADPVYDVTHTNLFYYRKDGNVCGVRYPMAVDDVTDAGKQLSIWPNPAGSTVTITVPGQQQYSYTLTNTLGQVVRHGQSTQASETISVAQLPPGIYYLNVLLPAGYQLGSKIVVVH
jgi:hypothetical protein